MKIKEEKKHFEEEKSVFKGAPFRSFEHTKTFVPQNVFNLFFLQMFLHSAPFVINEDILRSLEDPPLKAIANILNMEVALRASVEGEILKVSLIIFINPDGI